MLQPLLRSVNKDDNVVENRSDIKRSMISQAFQWEEHIPVSPINEDKVVLLILKALVCLLFSPLQNTIPVFDETMFQFHQV